jgi:hypothetical protein
MTTQQKALELWSSYRALLSLPGAPLGDDKDRVAKECAKYAVYRIIENSNEITRIVQVADAYANEWYEVLIAIDKINEQ